MRSFARLRRLLSVGAFCRGCDRSVAGDWRPSSTRAVSSASRRVLPDGPGLEHFLAKGSVGTPGSCTVAEAPTVRGSALKVYLETYGCQMNVSDSQAIAAAPTRAEGSAVFQVVLAILKPCGYERTAAEEEADLILLNTCAIREKPENKVWTRLRQLRRTHQHKSVIGVLGCMAERVRAKLLDTERLADLVVGPDAYRELPAILNGLQTRAIDRSSAMNVALSLEETYADVVPVRSEDRVTAFLPIMRGCNNMCAFCIVPFTRGRERSRSMSSILTEVKRLRDDGVREITLLGQNVNSYCDRSAEATQSADDRELRDPFSVYAPGFTSVYKPRRAGAANFAQLLDAVADVDDAVRIRFTSPHPKDFSPDVIDVVRSRVNVCKQLHVPAQSGSSAVLRRMKRGYDREAYDALIRHIRQDIPEVALSTDIIVGFSGETEEEFAQTTDLIRSVGYDNAFLFKYSEREKTYAHRHLADDVPSEVKRERLTKAIEVYREQLFARNQREIGKTHLVLVEERARKEEGFLTGRTDTFKRVVFADRPVEDRRTVGSKEMVTPRRGDYVAVKIRSATHGTLRAVPLVVTTPQGPRTDERLTDVHDGRGSRT